MCNLATAMNFWFALTDSIFLGFITKVTKRTCLRSVNAHRLILVYVCMWIGLVKAFAKVLCIELLPT